MSLVPVRKVLLLDDSADYRALLKKFFETAHPDAAIVEYDPLSSGKPPQDFDWSAYDLLILDYDLGQGENGLEWLREFKTNSHFPATIILTAKDDEELVVEAQKFGAQGFLRKVGLKKSQMASAIRVALAKYSKQMTQARALGLKSHYFNKEKFLKSLDKACHNDALVLIKIDGFGELTEKLGDSNLGNLITFTAEHIQKIVVQSDLAGTFTRMTNSVFGVFLRDCKGIEQIEGFAKNLCRLFEQEDFMHQGQNINYTISAGITFIDDESMAVADIVRKAEQATMRAREKPGNTFAISHKQNQAEKDMDAGLASEINSAVKEERITPLYQSLVQISESGHPHYDELHYSILNLTDSEKNLIEPKQFLPLLEGTQAINALDRWMVRHCLVELSKHKRKINYKIGIFIALSGQSLEDKDLSDWISKIINRLKISDLGQSIILDVDATMFLAHIRTAKLQLNKLRIKIGCPLALRNIEDLEMLERCMQAGSFDFVSFSPEHNRKGKMEQPDIQKLAGRIRDFKAIPIASKIDSGLYLSLTANAGVDYVQGHFVQPPMEHIVSSEQVIV